jgi:hypothetical protein
METQGNLWGRSDETVIVQPAFAIAAGLKLRRLLERFYESSDAESNVALGSHICVPGGIPLTSESHLMVSLREGSVRSELV